MEKTDPQFPNWAELQQQYLEALTAFSRGATGAGNGANGANGTNPWTGALEYWWRSVTPAVAESQQALVENMLNQAQTWFAVSGQFGKLLTAMAAAPADGSDWQKVLDQQLEAIKAGLDNAGRAGSGAAQANPLAAFWQLPLDNWERLVSSVSAMPGDMLKGFKSEAAAASQDTFPSLPGLGYTREMQEQYQEGIRLWAEYQKHLAEYQGALVQVGIVALDRIRVKLLSGQRTIARLRDFYDLWVECNEEAYAAHVFTREYSERYGRMVNSLMAFKRHAQMLMDEMLGALNMPTQRDIVTMQKRQMEMRRELRAAAARQAADSHAIAALRKELDALKRDRSRGQGSSQPAARSGGSAGRGRTGKKSSK